MSGKFLVLAFDDQNNEETFTLSVGDNEIILSKEEIKALQLIFSMLSDTDKPYWRYYEIILRDGVIVKENKQTLSNQEIYPYVQATKTRNEDVHSEPGDSIEARLARSLTDQSNAVAQQKRKYTKRSSGGNSHSLQSGPIE